MADKSGKIRQTGNAKYNFGNWPIGGNAEVGTGKLWKYVKEVA